MMNLGVIANGRRQQRTTNPLASIRHTRPQACYVGDTRSHVLWRDGNQLGKSFALAFFIVLFALGLAPHCRRFVPPYEVMVIGYSFSQMDPLLGKIWLLLPKDRLDPKVQYVKKQGFKGHKQQHVTVYTDSTRQQVLAHIVLGTYEAGPQAIMGDSVHLVALDEPPPEEVYNEAVTRVSYHNGYLRIVFTPTPDAPPLGYLRKLVAKGEIAEHNYGLNEPNCTLYGGRARPRPLRRQAAIDKWAAKLMPMLRPQRLHGAWDALRGGRQFVGFDPRHTCFSLPAGAVKVGLALDHGARANRQAALLGITDGHSLWILGEYRPEGATSSKRDAIALRDLLRRWDWSWADVDYFVGDRAVDSGSGRKSNELLESAISELVGKPLEEIGPEGLHIATAWKPANSVIHGIETCNNLFFEDRLWISPDCVGLIESLKGWEGDKRDPRKDLLDALRYLVNELIRNNVIEPPSFELEAA